jgi:hypothetical protein
MFNFFLKHEKFITQCLLWLAFGVFVAALVSFGINFILPGIIPERFVPTSLFAAISPAIAVLLVYELFVLTLGTRGSFVNFIHREFEIISLIILRDVFKQLDSLSRGVSPQLLTDLAIIAIGSLVLYLLVEVLERVKQQIVSGKLDQAHVSQDKLINRMAQVVETGLLIYFIAIVIYEGVGWLLGIQGLGFSTQFLELVFMALVAYNIINLFMTLIVSHTYETLFEHSALVLASSVVFITLSEPPYITVPTVTGALAFVVLTLFLHGFARGESLSWSMSKIKRTKK